MKTRSDLPIKYYLDLYNEEALCDKHTILFEISQYLIKVLNSKSKEIDLASMKFSSKSLKYVFGEKIKDETFKANLVKSLKSLISDGSLEPRGDFMFFTQNGMALFYTL